MTDSKVIYHGATVYDGSGTTTGNPPPYTPTPAGVYPHPPPQGPYTQQPQFGGPPMMQATVVTTGGPVLIATQHVGLHPTRITCNACNYQIVTRVETTPTCRTHMFAALLCLIGCWPCVCLPYCVDGCMSTNHYCPNCNAYIGTYM